MKHLQIIYYATTRMSLTVIVVRTWLCRAQGQQEDTEATVTPRSLHCLFEHIFH